MTTDLLILQHNDLSAPGLIETVAGAHERNVHIIRPDVADTVPETADDAWAVVVLGGDMAAWDEAKFPWIKDEVKLLAACIAAGTPVLGICLGAQLVARAAGARNYKGGMPEIGWYPVDLEDSGKSDPLFAGVPPQFKIWQWHTDTFDLPEGAVHLASSRLFPNQAFRIGKAVYGVQFHPEKTGAIIERAMVERKAELEKYSGIIDPNRIRRETEKALAKANAVGQRIIENFLGTAFL